MTLQQCSKADLLWVIERICMRNLSRCDLDIALIDLAYEKEKTRIEEAQKYAKLADEKRRAYIALLEPYDGMKWVDIPLEVLEQGAKLQEQATAADRKWAKLLGINLSKPKEG